MTIPELTLLYDGSCPICYWEKRNLATKDRNNRLAFVDIQAPDFDATRYGVSMDDLMGRLHGVTRDGRLVVGVDTLIVSYRAVGWWWLYVPLSILPRAISSPCYDIFARNRHRISRRIGHWFGPACDSGTCKRKQ